METVRTSSARSRTRKPASGVLTGQDNFDFDAEVAAFYKTYPHMQHKVYFIETSRRTVIDGGVADLEPVIGQLRANHQLQYKIMRSQKSGGCVAVEFSEAGYSCILVNTQAIQKNDALVTLAMSSSAANRYAVGHEIGHRACPHGMVDSFMNRSECAADGYSTVSLIRAFGDKGRQMARDAAALRAVELVFRDDDGDHFTTPVTEKIVDDSYMPDFSKLEAAEVSAIADSYAMALAFPPEKVRRLSDYFGDFKYKFPAVIDGKHGVAEKFADAVAGMTNPQDMHWGALALDMIFGGKVSHALGKPVLDAGRGALKSALDYVATQDARYSRDAGLKVRRRALHL